MKSELLWISLRAPYDKVTHAGGKNHNFMLKEFYKSGLFHINLMTFARDKERKNIDLERYGIAHTIFYFKTGKRREDIRSLLDTLGMPISLFEYAFVRAKIKESIRRCRKENYCPEYIILQWTEIVLLLPYIKRRFKNSKIICIEEDVTFLKLERKYKKYQGFKAWVLKAQYYYLRTKEIKALSAADSIVVLNGKDKRLLTGNGVRSEQIFVTTPYYDEMEVNYHSGSKNILFYGAMGRPENIEAVKWFIEYVMPGLEKYDPNIKFVVMGANPAAELLNLNKNNIIVTGYVDDIRAYLEDCLCMVVPLQLGAGIKIKVLEGMAAGIPVLANEIGIEGIPAEDGTEYLFCASAQDFKEGIIKLMEDTEYAEAISRNSKRFMKNTYNKEEKIRRLMEAIRKI